MGSLKHIENCSVFAVFSLLVELNSRRRQAFNIFVRLFCPMSLQIVAPNFHHFTMFPPISYDAWHLMAFTRVIFRRFLVLPKPHHYQMKLASLATCFHARFKGSKLTACRYFQDISNSNPCHASRTFPLHSKFHL